MEIWKPIPGFEGYEASDLGNFRSFIKKGPGEGLTDNPHMLKARYRPRSNSTRVGTVLVNMKNRPWTASRLVLLAHVGPPPEGKPSALHTDDDPTNNNLTNLRWGSHAENAEDAFRNGRTTYKPRYVPCPHCGEMLRIKKSRNDLKSIVLIPVTDE